MAKLMENTYRDVNIALANELTKVAAHIGVNPLQVIELANKHQECTFINLDPALEGIVSR